MTSHPMSAHLESLAWHIDRFGFDATTQQHLHDLRLVAEQAGVRPGLTELLVDDSAPSPVRNRAFGQIASFVARHVRAQHGPATTTATTPAVVTDEQVACAA